MCNLHFMHIIYCAHNLFYDRCYLFFRSELSMLNSTQQTPTFTILSDNIKEILIVENIVKLNNTNMIHFPQNVNFCHKRFLITVFHYFLFENLDSPNLPSFQTLTSQDTPKSTFANFIKHLILGINGFKSNLKKTVPCNFYIQKIRWLL